MSHLPIKEVDYYLDKISSKHVLFVGGAVIILLVVFGPTVSNMLYGTSTHVRSAGIVPGRTSDHYLDGIMRTPTVDSISPEYTIFPRLYATAPYVVPPYQDELPYQIPDTL